MPVFEEDEINRRIGANIRFHRSRRGWTQTDLGRILGVSYQQVQKFENGKDRIAASQVVRIAREFGIDADQLLVAALPSLRGEPDATLLNSG